MHRHSIVLESSKILGLDTELGGLGADGSKGKCHVCVEHLLVSNLVMIALLVTRLNTKRDCQAQKK